MEVEHELAKAREEYDDARAGAERLLGEAARHAQRRGLSVKRIGELLGFKTRQGVYDLWRRTGLLLVLGLAVMALAPAPADAKHSWNGRYWAEQPIRVVDYTAQRAHNPQRWRSGRDEALAAWEASGVVQFRVHEARGPRCKPLHGGFGTKAVGRLRRDFPDGQISLCQLVGGHLLMAGFTTAPRRPNGAIREAVVAVSSPNSLCHEIGHAIGLSHPRFDPDARSCLGWGWRKPGVHDLEMLRLIYAAA